MALSAGVPLDYLWLYDFSWRVFYHINSLHTNRKSLVAFAQRGEWRGFVGILASIVKENFAVRDAVEGEKVVQSTLVALLTAAKGPYYVKHEHEAGGGFYDIALAPQLDRWPEIAHAALIEMKYVKAGDPAPAPQGLADIKSKAIAQLDRYSSDSTLVSAWHLKPTTSQTSQTSQTPQTPQTPQTSQTPQTPQTVSLHKLVLVFHGGECVLADEV